VHHGCPRNEYYEFKASAEKHSDQGCLMEQLGCKGTQAHADCNQRLWNGEGSCLRGGYACIRCTEPGFEEPGHAFESTPKVAGIPIGLPADMPKAWFIALAALSKSATPARVRENAHRRPPVARALGEAGEEMTTGASSAPSIASRAISKSRSTSTTDGSRGLRQLAAVSRLRADPARQAAGRCAGAGAAHLRHLLGGPVGRRRAGAGRCGGHRAAANGRLAANLTLAAENLADHLTHFYLFFMPDFAREDYKSRRWHDGAVAALSRHGGQRAERGAAGARALHADDGPARRQMAAHAGGAARRLDAAAAKLGDIPPAPHPARISRIPRNH
jgi:hypothetical protein